MCPISLMCLIFFAENVGNNIKRAHVMKLCHFDLHGFFSTFYVISNI